MTAKRAKRRGISLSWAGWWIAVAILLFAKSVGHLTSTVGLLPPLHSCVEEGREAWNVPATVFADGDVNAAIPLHFAIIACVIVISLMIAAAAKVQPWTATCAVIGVGWLLDFDQFVPAILLLIVTYCTPRDATKKVVLLLGAVCIVAVGCTLEFGLIWSVALSGLVSCSSLKRRHRVWIAVVAAGIVVGGMIWSPFGRALIRPLTAGWFGSGISFFPQLQSPLHNEQFLPIGILLAIGGVVLLRGRRKAFVPTAILLAVGLATTYYLSICAVGLAGLLLHSGSKDESQHRLPAMVCCLILTVLFSWRILDVSAASLLEPRQDRIVDTSKWNLDGPVLLSNLDNARLWHHTNVELVVNDRWDCVGHLYRTHDAIVRDLRLGRRERYLRSDGSWGGFGVRLREWNPAAIELSSRDFKAVRQTSLDPAWNIASIDGTRTIFAATKGSLRNHASRTMQLLYRLEWPRRNANYETTGRIVSGNRVDEIAIASVLNSIRFPYAALRILPDEPTPETELVSLWSAAEVSHRTLRQTGRPDIFQHFQAVTGLRKLLASGLDGNSAVFATQLLHQLNSILANSPENNIIVQLQLELSASPPKLAQNVQTEGINQKFRQLCQPLDSLERSEVVNRLVAIGQNDTNTGSDRSEALFLAGSQQLSLGDPERAKQLISQSLKLFPDSPYRQLIAIHLSQLGSGGAAN